MLEHNRAHNIELVPPERRKHSLVLKADFPALEERKKVAAMKWMEAHAWQYQHTQNQVEKKAEWEMQRQDANVAKENAMYDRLKQLGTGPVKPGKEATKIELLTKCLIEGLDYRTMMSNVTDLSSKKVTPMKSSHTAHSSPLPTAKKAALQKSGNSNYDAVLNLSVRGGTSETKLRLDKSHSSTPGSTKPTSYNDVSVSFDNLTNSNISYSNYQPIVRVKKDLE
jgi:hypothetical protein